MTLVRLWTLIGEANTGKSRSISTLISHLDGERAEFNDVLLRGGGELLIYGKVMAWQEHHLTPDQTVDAIKQRVKAQTVKLHGHAPYAVNVLSALRFDQFIHQGAKYPWAADYLGRWVDEGWTLKSLVLMSPDSGGSRDLYGSFGAPTLWHYDFTNMPVEVMVGKIRNHFGWA